MILLFQFFSLPETQELLHYSCSEEKEFVLLDVLAGFQYFY